METLKKAIISELAKLNDRDWHTAKINIDFPPYINKGFTGIHYFYDKDGKQVKLFLTGDQQFHFTLYNFIYDVNKEGIFNQIIISAQHDKLEEAKISVEFKQAIIDNFESLLPKSKRGKTTPWWKNPDEVKGLL